METFSAIPGLGPHSVILVEGDPGILIPKPFRNLHEGFRALLMPPTCGGRDCSKGYRVWDLGLRVQDVELV